MIKPSLVSGIIVLAMTGSLGYHTAYVRPREALEHVRKQLREAQQEHELRSHVALSLGTLERERQAFAPKPQPEWLLEEVERLAREFDITVASLTPHPTREWADGTLLIVSAQFHATYHQLGQFMSRLEGSDHLIRVDELEIAPDPAKPNLAKIRLVVSALYVPLPQPEAF